MDATTIDPRDTNWESEAPAYRVYFWHGTRDSSYRSSEWRLTGGDIHEVLEWANENAAGRYVTIWVESHDSGSLGLVRLSGWEPTRTDDPPGDYVQVAD